MMELKLKGRFYLMIIIVFILIILLPFFSGCGGKDDPILGGLYCDKSYTYSNTTLNQCQSFKNSKDCSNHSWSSSDKVCYLSDCCD